MLLMWLSIHPIRNRCRSESALLMYAGRNAKVTIHCRIISTQQIQFQIGELKNGIGNLGWEQKRWTTLKHYRFTWFRAVTRDAKLKRLKHLSVPMNQVPHANVPDIVSMELQVEKKNLVKHSTLFQLMLVIAVYSAFAGASKTIISTKYVWLLFTR